MFSHSFSASPNLIPKSDRTKLSAGKIRGLCNFFFQEETRPSALGMSDPVMEFLDFHEKGKIFWEDFEGEGG